MLLFFIYIISRYISEENCFDEKKKLFKIKYIRFNTYENICITKLLLFLQHTDLDFPASHTWGLQNFLTAAGHKLDMNMNSSAGMEVH